MTERPLRTLGDALTALSSRWKRVDMSAFDRVLSAWPTMVEPVLAERCRPTMIKEGVLIVATPSGIFAEQIRLRDAEILRLCLAVAPGSMHSVRAVVE